MSQPRIAEIFVFPSKGRERVDEPYPKAKPVKHLRNWIGWIFANRENSLARFLDFMARGIAKGRKREIG
jgi:hypothetical protein